MGRIKLPASLPADREETEVRRENRMGKTGSVEKYGATFPDAYCVAGSVAMDFIRQVGHGTFNTFASQPARDASEDAINQRTFSLTLAEIQELLNEAEFTSFIDNINRQRADMYLIASKIRDLKEGYVKNEDGTYSDASGKPASESKATSNFFDGWNDV